MKSTEKNYVSFQQFARTRPTCTTATGRKNCNFSRTNSKNKMATKKFCFILLVALLHQDIAGIMATATTTQQSSHHHHYVDGQDKGRGGGEGGIRGAGNNSSDGTSNSGSGSNTGQGNIKINGHYHSNIALNRSSSTPSRLCGRHLQIAIHYACGGSPTTQLQKRTSKDGGTIRIPSPSQQRRIVNECCRGAYAGCSYNQLLKYCSATKSRSERNLQQGIPRGRPGGTYNQAPGGKLDYSTTGGSSTSLTTTTANDNGWMAWFARPKLLRIFNWFVTPPNSVENTQQQPLTDEQQQQQPVFIEFTPDSDLPDLVVQLPPPPTLEPVVPAPQPPELATPDPAPAPPTTVTPKPLFNQQRQYTFRPNAMESDETERDRYDQREMIAQNRIQNWLDNLRLSTTTTTTPPPLIYVSREDVQPPSPRPTPPPRPPTVDDYFIKIENPRDRSSYFPIGQPTDIMLRS